MKKALALAASLTVLGTFAFADGFSLDGYLRAGYSTTAGSDTNISSTETFIGGYYFSESSRLRVNMAWDNEDKTCGAFLRLQQDSDVATLSDAFSYAYAYDSLFDGLLTVTGGKMMDNWAKTSWNEYSAFDGETGAAAVITPVKGLSLIAAASTDNLDANDATSFITDKDLASFAAQYNADTFTIGGGYKLAGTGYASATFSGLEGLFADVEYSYDGTGTTASHDLTEWFDFNMVKKLNFGLLAGQTITTTLDSVYFNPYTKYTFNDIFAASFEAKYDWILADKTSNTLMISPCIYLSGPASAVVVIWGQDDYATSGNTITIGTGVKKDF